MGVCTITDYEAQDCFTLEPGEMIVTTSAWADLSTAAQAVGWEGQVTTSDLNQLLGACALVLALGFIFRQLRLMVFR